jgi:hypothetical protein
VFASAKAEFRFRTTFVPLFPSNPLFLAHFRGSARNADCSGGAVMRKLEYMLSVMLALLVLGGMIAWTQASQGEIETAASCRPGRASAPVMLKGMSLFPRCPGGGKRS